jgi:hypothetical protein
MLARYLPWSGTFETGYSLDPKSEFGGTIGYLEEIINLLVKPASRD